MAVDYTAPGAGAGGSSFDWGNVISGGLGAAGSVIGAGQLKNGIGAANAQQQQTYQQIAGIYQPQYNLGTGADQGLASALGLNGAVPNYAAFENTPGYQFALQQGDQAINRQAAATGNAYNSSTLAALDKYNTGLASQTYQNYVQNLLSTAGLGNQAAGGMAQYRYGTGANIGQGLANIGAANASGVAGVGQALTGLAGPVGGLLGNFFRGAGGGGGGGGGSPYTGANIGGGGDPYLSGAYSGLTDQSGTPYYLAANPGSIDTSGAGTLASGNPDWLNTGGFDPSGALASTGFNAAGGEAAGQNASGVAPQVASDAPSTDNSAYAAYSASAPTSGANAPSLLGQIGTGVGAAGNALAIYNGLQRGGVTGYGSAALNAANLANNASKLTTGSPLIGGAAGGALGAAGGALGLYNGLKTGGTLGYTNAALGAANTAAGIGTLAGGTAAGGVGSLAAIGSFAGPLGLALAPVLFGASQPAVQLSGSYWNGLRSGLQSSDQWTKQSAEAEIVGMITNGDQTLPPDLQQYALQNGLYQQAKSLQSNDSYVGGKSGTRNQL